MAEGAESGTPFSDVDLSTKVGIAFSSLHLSISRVV